jgi:hypothetical protein
MCHKLRFAIVSPFSARNSDAESRENGRIFRLVEFLQLYGLAADSWVSRLAGSLVKGSPSRALKFQVTSPNIIPSLV